MEEAKRTDAGLIELLCDVIRYRRGLGKYNLSHLHGQDRWNTSDDLWQELEASIEAALIDRGIKVT